MTELVHSFELLRQRGDPAVFDGWRRRTRQRLEASVRPLSDLVPPYGWWPAFLEPHVEDGLAGALDAIRAMPRAGVRRSLAAVTRHRRLPPWTRHLADGDAELMAQLTQAIEAYHAAGLDPYRQRMRARHEAELALRARLLAGGGIAGVFTGLHPTVRWTPPVLHIPWPVDEDFHLSGRGLTLVPSIFARIRPEPHLAADPPQLTYPIPADPLDFTTIWSPATKGGEALAALLGSTRAAVLETIASACTTGEIARRLDIALASASEHAAVLRRAGLVVSQRHRNTTLHSLTPLGTELLDK
jgi:DNA-binding transcriptional ArsR family regulator